MISFTSVLICLLCLGHDFMFSTLETWFQIVVDKLVLYQKTNYYKGKELLIEEDEDDAPTRYVKARLEKLFQT